MGTTTSLQQPRDNRQYLPNFPLVQKSDDGDRSPYPDAQSAKALVVAIDLGTTYSGYAFSFGHDKYNISSNNWQQAPVVREKAPTCLLLKPDQTLDSFGYVAKQKYSNLTANDEHRRWFFFWQFKMTLHQTRELNGSYKIKAENGEDVDALVVFGLSLHYIKDECMNIIKRSGSILKEKDITWVITVPAIWKESAKKFMRKAAEKAGLDKSRVEIALEPEAAALFCHSLHLTKDMANPGPYQKFDPGTRYMLLDCGGGTVDVAVHEVLPENKLKELHVASGGDWGGSKVNKAFLSFMSNLVGPPTWQTFSVENKEDYICLIDEFEGKKRNMNPNSEGVERIRLPLALQELLRKVDQQRMKEKHNGKVSIVGDKLNIDSGIFKGFFKPVIDEISNHVSQLLKTVPGPIAVILLVGGFSESKLLQKEIEPVIGDHCQLIIPLEASLCVVKGAVLYGHDPLRVTHRKIPFTYGIATTIPFKPDKFPLKRKVIIGGQEMCDEVFDKHVTIGQEVRTGEATEKKKYYPMTPQDTVIALRLYRSTQQNPTFVDEDSCQLVGSFLINLPKHGVQTTNSGRRGAEVKLIFGGTDITVKATLDGREHETDFSF